MQLLLSYFGHKVSCPLTADLPTEIFSSTKTEF